MKTMKKTLGWLVMAAALTITTTACSSDDNIAENPTPTTPDAPKTYTMTVTASKSSDDATTRALTIDGTTLNATWTVDDKIKVMKRREMQGNVDYALLGTLSATTVSTDRLTATFTGSFTDANVSAAGGLAVGDKLLLGYPGDHLGNSTSAFVFNYNGQDGTLGTLASDYDYCMTTTSKNKMVSVASVDGGVVTTSGTASFTNEQAIVRFTLTGSDGITPVCPTCLDITAIGLEQSVALPESGGTSIANPTEQTLTLTPDGTTNVIYAALRGISGQTVTLNATVGGYSCIYEKADVTFENGKFYDIKVKLPSINLAALTADYTAVSGVLTGTLPSGIHLSIAAGASVTLKDVTISDASQAGITCLGNATITLSGTNTVTTTAEGYPAIQAGGSGTTLTIQGIGSVTATGAQYAAGIGTRSGSEYGTCGTITINGGTVTATGGQYGAGIGSGNNGSCGNITISGSANINATGGQMAAGIGSGLHSGAGEFLGSCGTITINGGTVTATGGQCGAGIGSGSHSICGTITIENTVTSVTAKKGNSAPVSIGAGANYSTCGTVTIGGTVYYDGSNFQNDGDTYLATSPLVYPAP